MGVNLLTALEIFTQPGDLEITIIQEKDVGRKYAFAISRGPEHDFKLLVTTRPFAETEDEVIETIKITLTACHDAAMEELRDDSGLAAIIVNPHGTKIDQSKILNKELIDRIVDEVRRNKVASTYRMLAPTG